jgi:lipopolysaccharide transport system ATP-binding protein
MSSDNPAIRVRDLSKCYEIYDRPQDRLKQSIHPRLQRLTGRQPKTYYREFWALKNVSFDVNKGEAVGIIGRNGAGKSTLLQIICGTLTPTSGQVEVNGRVAALLELGAGFNPDFTGRENVYVNAAILGFSREQVNAKFQNIEEFAEIGEFMDQPVKTYSSGMFVRLAFAVQVCVEPDILVVDEALAVGDVFFRQKCYARLQHLRNLGAAILLVSHSMTDIQQYCERAILLDQGSSRFIGPSSEATKHYYLLHQAERGKVPAQADVPMDVSENTPDHDAITRPPVEAFLELTGKTQVSNGKVRCTGVALCNADGDPCNVFRQGDKAVFYSEFELSNTIGVPICGIVISNDRGIIVHGKNSWQYDHEAPQRLVSGSKLACWQEIQLNLGPGEYTFEIGLASVSATDWKNREYISHEEFSIRHERLCHIPNVGHFSIGFALKAGFAILTHHGVADLPGKITMACVSHE